MVYSGDKEAGPLEISAAKKADPLKKPLSLSLFLSAFVTLTLCYPTMASLVRRARAAVKLDIDEVDAERSRWINEGTSVA